MSEITAMENVSQDEVYDAARLTAAAQLGVDPLNPDHMALVDDMLSPDYLRDGWSIRLDRSKKAWVWFRPSSGEEAGLHPDMDYYFGALYLDMGGFDELVAALEASPPRDEQADAKAAELGIGPEEDVYIQQVAEMALAAALPPGWEKVAGGSGQSYRHTAVGVVIDEHPLEPYWRVLIWRRRREIRIKQEAYRKMWKDATAVARAGVSIFRLPTGEQQAGSRPDASQQGLAPQASSAADHAVAGAGGAQGHDATSAEDQAISRMLAEWEEVRAAAEKLASSVGGAAAAMELVGSAEAGRKAMATTASALGPGPAGQAGPAQLQRQSGSQLHMHSSLAGMGSISPSSSLDAAGAAAMRAAAAALQLPGGVKQDAALGRELSGDIKQRAKRPSVLALHQRAQQLGLAPGSPSASGSATPRMNAFLPQSRGPSTNQLELQLSAGSLSRKNGATAASPSPPPPRPAPGERPEGRPVRGSFSQLLHEPGPDGKRVSAGQLLQAGLPPGAAARPASSTRARHSIFPPPHHDNLVRNSILTESLNLDTGKLWDQKALGAANPWALPAGGGGALSPAAQVAQQMMDYAMGTLRSLKAKIQDADAQLERCAHGFKGSAREVAAVLGSLPPDWLELLGRMPPDWTNLMRRLASGRMFSCNDKAVQTERATDSSLAAVLDAQAVAKDQAAGRQAVASADQLAALERLAPVLAKMPVDSLAALAALPPSAVAALQALPPATLAQLAAMTPEQLQLLQSAGGMDLKMLAWLQQLPQESLEWLQALPDGSLAMLQQMPADTWAWLKQLSPATVAHLQQLSSDVKGMLEVMSPDVMQLLEELPRPARQALAHLTPATAQLLGQVSAHSLAMLTQLDPVTLRVLDSLTAEEVAAVPQLMKVPVNVVQALLAMSPEAVVVLHGMGAEALAALQALRPKVLAALKGMSLPALAALQRLPPEALLALEQQELRETLLRMSPEALQALHASSPDALAALESAAVRQGLYVCSPEALQALRTLSPAVLAVLEQPEVRKALKGASPEVLQALQGLSPEALQALEQPRLCAALQAMDLQALRALQALPHEALAQLQKMNGRQLAALNEGRQQSAAAVNADEQLASLNGGHQKGADAVNADARSSAGLPPALLAALQQVPQEDMKHLPQLLQGMRGHSPEALCSLQKLPCQALQQLARLDPHTLTALADLEPDVVAALAGAISQQPQLLTLMQVLQGLPPAAVAALQQLPPDAVQQALMAAAAQHLPASGQLPHSAELLQLLQRLPPAAVAALKQLPPDAVQPLVDMYLASSQRAAGADALLKAIKRLPPTVLQAIASLSDEQLQALQKMQGQEVAQALMAAGAKQLSAAGQPAPSAELLQLLQQLQPEQHELLPLVAKMQLGPATVAALKQSPAEDISALLAAAALTPGAMAEFARLQQLSPEAAATLARLQSQQLEELLRAPAAAQPLVRNQSQVVENGGQRAAAVNGAMPALSLAEAVLQLHLKPEQLLELSCLLQHQGQHQGAGANEPPLAQLLMRLVKSCQAMGLQPLAAQGMARKLLEALLALQPNALSALQGLLQLQQAQGASGAASGAPQVAEMLQQLKALQPCAPQLQSLLQKLSVNGGGTSGLLSLLGEMQALPGDCWQRVLSTLPANWQELERTLPQDWYHLLPHLAHLPHNWQELVARLPPNWLALAAAGTSLPEGGEGKSRNGRPGSLAQLSPISTPTAAGMPYPSRNGSPPSFGMQHVLQPLQPAVGARRQDLPVKAAAQQPAHQHGVESHQDVHHKAGDGKRNDGGDAADTDATATVVVRSTAGNHKLGNRKSSPPGSASGFLPSIEQSKPSSQEGKQTQQQNGSAAEGAVSHFPAYSSLQSRKQQRAQTGRAAWDARPALREVVPRVKRLADSDMALEVNSDLIKALTQDLPDELLDRNLTTAEITHLKQRLVRSEKQRNDLGARMVAERRHYTQEMAVLQHRLDEAEYSQWCLKQEVERLRAAAGLPTLSSPNNAAGSGGLNPLFKLSVGPL